MENTVQLEMIGKRIKLDKNGNFPGAVARITGITGYDDGSYGYLARYEQVPQDATAVGMEISFDAQDIAEVL